MQDHFGERYGCSGYICADRFIARNGFIAVQGNTKVVAFEDAYPLEWLDPATGRPPHQG